MKNLLIKCSDLNAKKVFYKNYHVTKTICLGVKIKLNE